MLDVRLYGTTAAGGGKTVTSTEVVRGFLYKVVWIDGTLDDGVDAVLSNTNTPEDVDVTLLTLTNANDDVTYYPRALVHGAAGAALTGTAGGDREKVYVSGNLKLAITSGGNAKAGGCVVYIEED